MYESSDAKNFGIEFLVGVETEFTLLKSTDPIERINMSAYGGSSALITGSTAATVLEEIVRALKVCGIEVIMYHSEASGGQVRGGFTLHDTMG